MFNKKKIEKLQKTLYDALDMLDNKIEILEFKLNAENKKYIVEPFIPGYIRIKFLAKNETKVIAETFKNDYIKVKQNDKYLEFWRSGWAGHYLDKVMYVSDDKLVNMDVGVYTKAFYPEKKNCETEED